MEPPAKRQRTINAEEFERLLAELPPELLSKYQIFADGEEKKEEPEQDPATLDQPPQNLREVLVDFWVNADTDERHVILELNQCAVPEEIMIAAYIVYISMESDIKSIEKQFSTGVFKKLFDKTPVLSYKNELLASKDQNKHKKIDRLLLDVSDIGPKLPVVALNLTLKLTEVENMVCSKLKVGVKRENENFINPIATVQPTTTPVLYPALYQSLVTNGYDKLVAFKTKLDSLHEDIQNTQLTSIHPKAAQKLETARKRIVRRNKQKKESRKKKKEQKDGKKSDENEDEDMNDA